MPSSPESHPELVDARIEHLGDWRGAALAHIRALIRHAEPDVIEDVKWRKPSNGMLGVPVWSRFGILCTGESYKDKVKLTFARGADVADPAGLFNSSLAGKVRRAIDLREGDAFEDAAFVSLIRAAAAVNAAARGVSDSPAPTLLSGGNPQIPKGDGDGPVQAYIAAMPGWKAQVGRDLDALIALTVPDVTKAMRWNAPLYGVEGHGWFLSFRCFTRYIKLTFFQGAALDPVPPIASKDVNARFLHIHEGESFDRELLVRWIQQASELPGWSPWQPLANSG